MTAGPSPQGVATERPPDLGRLLAPASVAVVGATDRSGSYAAEALLNLEKIGFSGPVWGVNPRRTEVLGRPCVPTLADLPSPVDAVIVAIPAAGVPDVVAQAGERGCGGAVVFSAGFAEVASGVTLQAEVVAAARRHGLAVAGPNCNGVVSPHHRFALWGDALEPREAGAVALVSQSGNVAVNALATRRGLRLHTVIASGNQAVLSAADFLEHLAACDGVRSVALYLEDDGGASLCDGLAACADAGLPVVVLKVGRSPAGTRAAAAHSAALTGDQRVFRSLIDDAGAVWADDLHDLLELAKTLAVRRRPACAGRAGALDHAAARDRSGTGDGFGAGDGSGAGHGSAPGGLAIMTCSGGDSAQGADEAAALGLRLPALAPATSARLAALLPSAATVANPLDYTAMIWGDRGALAQLIRIVGEDPSVDQVLVFYDQPHGLTGAPEESWRAVREGIADGAARSPVATLVSSTLPDLLDDAAAWELGLAGVPAVAGLRTGLRCAAAMLGAGAGPGVAGPGVAGAGVAGPGVAGAGVAGAGVAGAGVAGAGVAGAAGRGERLREIAAGARSHGDVGDGRPAWLAEHEAKALLRAAGIAVPAGRIVAGPDDAVAAWRELGGDPVAVKLSAASVQHKSELGGVALRLAGEAAIREAYARLAALAAGREGSVLVERMAAPGVELIIAAVTAGVVPALVVGLGGIWTELLGDVAVVPLPASPSRVEHALRSLRGAGVLLGGRGGGAVDVGAAARLGATLGELLVARSLRTVECNPVIVGADGAIAVDAAIMIGV